MQHALLSTYERNLDHARRLVNDLDDEKMVVQPVRGMNHPAWVLGHLTCTCDVAMRVIGESPVAPSDWAQTFGPRTEPVADRQRYPDRDVLLDALEQCHEAVAERVGALSADAMQAAPEDARFQKRWPTRADALLHVMIGHEQMHLGQVSALRRAQALPPV